MTKVSASLQRAFELQSQQQWVNKASTAEQRIEKLLRLKQAISSREKELQKALHLDLGKTEAGVQLELMSTYAEIDHTIEQLAEWMAPTEVEVSSRFTGGRARITYEALGIVLLFGPWNYPFAIVFKPLTAILAAGNCALVKPNEMAPHTSELTADIIREAFDEQDVAVFEGGVDLANQLLELPVNHIFFTGSPAIGKIVMAAAAKNLASVTLELGGKNPVIIDRTADLQDAAEKIAVTRNSNCGQTCLSPEYVWVPEEKLQEFLVLMKATYQALFYQDDKFNTDAVGKIVDLRNFQRVTAYIDDARGMGANVIFGGEVDAEALTIQPTIMTDVPANAKIMQEETFGPVLTVSTYQNVDEVVSKIQQQPKPLALYLFTEDDSFIETILQRTSSGGVTVNHCTMHYAEPKLPFGGVNNSGIGAYHGEHGFKELSHQRSVLIL